MGFVTSAQNFDVVSLGDVVTDEFIRLPEDLVRVVSDNEGRWLQLPLGTKLIVGDDTQPAAGGSAANAAVAMSRLGLRVGLASYLAHDQIGLDILSAMRGEGVGTDLVHVDSPNHTVRNFVLSFGGERTILVRHADFNYQWKGFKSHDLPAWLYINSLGPDALTYQDELADWLDEHVDVRLAFQPGSFQVEAGAERLARLYARAEMLLCSRTNAERIAGTSDPEKALDILLQLGARSVIIFDELGGAIAATRAERMSIDPFASPDPVIDLTGAGDAFAATAVAALISGLSLREALRWAAANFASTARRFGTQAGLLHRDDLEARVDEATTFAARDL